MLISRLYYAHYTCQRFVLTTTTTSTTHVIRRAWYHVGGLLCVCFDRTRQCMQICIGMFICAHVATFFTANETIRCTCSMVLTEFARRESHVHEVVAEVDWCVRRAHHGLTGHVRVVHVEHIFVRRRCGCRGLLWPAHVRQSAQSCHQKRPARC